MQVVSIEVDLHEKMTYLAGYNNQYENLNAFI